MSKQAQNRNKKSPMFVSNMVSQYDFVDYTGPGKAPPSAFGNPNSLAPQGSPPKPQQAPSPQKVESTNWFDQMLKNQQQTQASSPNRSNNVQVVESRSTKIESYQSNYSSNKGGPFSNGQTAQQQPLQSFQQSPNKPQEVNFGKKEAPFESRPQQQFTSAATATFKYSNQGFGSNTSFETSNKPSYGQPVQQQPNSQQQSEFEYNFKTKTEPSYPSSKPEPAYQPGVQQPSRPTYDDNYSNKFSQGNSQYSRPQQQQQFQSPPLSQSSQQSKTSGYSSGAGYASTGSTSGSGFSNEDLVNCLPQPARSNILAMIRRSKGRN